ncbi:uncharacterized protein HMPREF1541_07037 [Cyphellophora europaea CBS 101466]|uniref:Heterokaryon incompatibility domain-containing protein n=1 Tax=Cyphellophora europaea (strain CBS 101466) TaxID=1220924 RepID=W2RRQ3_CYPE1|nr:uncharacterized protein HMPREF1541_07037 [Cyphellophora europaea CBS 101466]ETN38995.1 hypothetical protein HMPREF1541_07037 [Cyphellophora europaea CBS 101466]
MELADPSAKDELYIYEPLDSNKHEIRLITLLPRLTKEGLIQCKLQHVTFLGKSELEVKYFALSYMWGDNQSPGTILINGKKQNVQPNLHNFLQTYRRCYKKRKVLLTPLWIDALCIDQRNVLERNHQVGIMQDIYRSAHEVVVWLGQGNKQIERLCSAPNAFRLFFKNCGVNRLPEPCWNIIWAVFALLRGEHDFHSAARDFLELPYWTRAWVVPENMLSRRRSFWYGANRVSTATMQRILYYGRLCKPRPSSPSPMEAFGRRGIEGLFSALVRFERQDCSEPFDHVYALIGLSAEDIRFPVDYNHHPVELLIHTMAVCFRDVAKDPKNIVEPHRALQRVVNRLASVLGVRDAIDPTHATRDLPPIGSLYLNFQAKYTDGPPLLRPMLSTEHDAALDFPGLEGVAALLRWWLKMRNGTLKVESNIEGLRNRLSKRFGESFILHPLLESDSMLVLSDHHGVRDFRHRPSGYKAIVGRIAPSWSKSPQPHLRSPSLDCVIDSFGSDGLEGAYVHPSTNNREAAGLVMDQASDLRAAMAIWGLPADELVRPAILALLGVRGSRCELVPLHSIAAAWELENPYDNEYDPSDLDNST